MCVHQRIDKDKDFVALGFAIYTVTVEIVTSRFSMCTIRKFQIFEKIRGKEMHTVSVQANWLPSRIWIFIRFRIREAKSTVELYNYSGLLVSSNNNRRCVCNHNEHVELWSVCYPNQFGDKQEPTKQVSDTSMFNIAVERIHCTGIGRILQ